MSRWRTLPGRDRIWLGLSTTVVVSTAEPTGLEALRDQLVRIARSDPGCVLFRVAHPDRPDRWRPAADVAEAVRTAQTLAVTVLPSADRETAARSVADLVEQGTPGPQVRVFVAESGDAQGLVGLSIPHVWGDSMTVLGLTRSLVTGPDPDGRLYVHVGRDRRRPLAAALRQRFGTVRALRAVPAARRAGVHRPAGGTVATHGAPVGGTPTPGDRSVSGVLVLPAVLEREVVRTLKVWRRESGSGATSNSIVMAALRSALETEGVALSDALVVAYDNRLYLPRDSSARGNLASALRLRPADPRDPEAVHAVVHEANVAGRPLLALAAGAVKSTLSRHRAWPAYPAPGGDADLSFACVRVDRLMPPRLLAGPGDEMHVIVVTTPGAHGSVAAMVVDFGTEVHVTVTAHGSRVDEDALRRALAAFCKDPVALLPAVGAEASTTA